MDDLDSSEADNTLVNDERPDRLDGVAIDVAESVIGPNEIHSPHSNTAESADSDNKLATGDVTMQPTNAEKFTVVTNIASNNTLIATSDKTDMIIVDTENKTTDRELDVVSTTLETGKFSVDIAAGKTENNSSNPENTAIEADSPTNHRSLSTIKDIEVIDIQSAQLNEKLLIDEIEKANVNSETATFCTEEAKTAISLATESESNDKLPNFRSNDASNFSIDDDDDSVDGINIFEPAIEICVSDSEVTNAKGSNIADSGEDSSQEAYFEPLSPLELSEKSNTANSTGMPTTPENETMDNVTSSSDGRCTMDQMETESADNACLKSIESLDHQYNKCITPPMNMDETRQDSEIVSPQQIRDTGALNDEEEDLLVPTDFVPDRDTVHVIDDMKRKLDNTVDSNEYGEHKKVKLSISCDDSIIGSQMHVERATSGRETNTQENRNTGESKMDASDQVLMIGEMSNNQCPTNQPPLEKLGDALAAPLVDLNADAPSESQDNPQPVALSADKSEQELSDDIQPDKELASCPSDENQQEASLPVSTPIDDAKPEQPKEERLDLAKFNESSFPFAKPKKLLKIDDASNMTQPSEPLSFADIIANTEYYMGPGRTQNSEICTEIPGDTDIKDKLPPTTAHTEDKSNDITETLKDMGEISLVPASKCERKLLPDGEIPTDEVSVEQIGGKQKGLPNETNDERRSKTNMRKNIREVMDDIQLDASTLAAQRQELERLTRVQEQQRIIREMQRQSAIERQQLKAQNKMMSMLQGNASLLKVSTLSGSAPLSKILGADVDTEAAVPSTSKTSNFMAKIISKKEASSDVDMVEITSMDGDAKSATAGSGSYIVEGSDDECYGDDDDIDDDDDCVELLSKKDVVTIDDSSDDDCILLSDEEDLEDTGDDDPQNSGLHVNDVFNKPDEHGQVLVNIGHPENEEDIFLAPQIARIIKPHQIGGVRFLFDNIIESVGRFRTSEGFGCILAHSMGLGKTLQLVCFCDIFLRHTNSKSVLCIMPINTLQNWMAEFNMWVPADPEATPLREQGEVRPRNFNLFVLNDTHKTLVARSKVILEWARDGGVLLIGYELYRLLSLKKMTRRRGRKAARDPELEEREAEEHKKTLDELHAALVSPGPDLVVCDEGHRIKNSHASTSVALKQIRSKRRIVLTGYPLQNNLLEYWCMVDFVRPNYLGTKTEFSNMFERPILNGQCIDSTPQDIKLMRYRAHVLHSLLLGFVQRRSSYVLHNSLPLKQEFVILVRLTKFQRQLYDKFMEEVVRRKAVPNPLKAFAVCCKVWNHPDVLYNFLKKREADLELEETDAAAAAEASFDGSSSTAKGPKKRTRRKIKKNDEISAKEEKCTINDINTTTPMTSNTNSVNNMTADTNDSKIAVIDTLKSEKPEFIKSEKSAFAAHSKPFDKPNNLHQPKQQQSSSYLNQFQSNPTQYNQHLSNGVYHSNYPYPGIHGFNASYNSYNQYDSNSYYNNFGQPNSYNNPIASRYYWNQSQHSQQPGSPSNQPNQSGFNFITPAPDNSSQQTSEFNSLEQWPQQQYSDTPFGAYPAGGLRYEYCIRILRMLLHMRCNV